jgi:flagellar biosynthesis chaperone FliJ
MENKMTQWRFERRMNLSVLVQLLTLAGLIVGSWVNLQRQLDLLGRDVKQLLATQEKFCEKMEQLQERTTAYEYRLRTLEEEIRNSKPEIRNNAQNLKFK